MKPASKNILLGLLFIISISTLLPILGLTHFHTKGEPREAIVAVSMLQDGNWILPRNNGGDIAYKPPMYHWITALGSAIFNEGEVNEYTSRLPSALATIIIASMMFLFYARREGNFNTAFLSAILFLSAFEVHRAATAARVDMVLTVFIVLALFQLYRWYEKGLKGVPLWAILFMSGATLTKGPVGIVLPCLVTGVFLLLRPQSLPACCLPCGILWPTCKPDKNFSTSSLKKISTASPATCHTVRTTLRHFTTSISPWPGSCLGRCWSFSPFSHSHTKASNAR